MLSNLALWSQRVDYVADEPSQHTPQATRRSMAAAARSHNAQMTPLGL